MLPLEQNWSRRREDQKGKDRRNNEEWGGNHFLDRFKGGITKMGQGRRDERGKMEEMRQKRGLKDRGTGIVSGERQGRERKLVLGGSLIKEGGERCL